MNDFLPDTYSVPDKQNGYLKFKIGDNRFRVMTSPIMGSEWWVDDGDKRKPMRARVGESVPVEFADTVKHFWAMVVYNYDAKQFQIMEVTQKSIQKALALLARNKKWGSPVGDKGYDIVIERSGEGLETEYSVTPEPKEELPNDVMEAFENLSINLEALFDGEDPFKVSIQ